MDLINAVVNFKQAELTSKVQYAVARKLLDSQQLQGSAAVRLIEAAGKTAQRGADELAVAATGLGSQIDLYG
jgi:hypothetical protein